MRRLKRPKLHRIKGADNRLHWMTLRRKYRRGIGQFRDVTQPMLAVDRQYIRQRAKNTYREAGQRMRILLLPGSEIARLVR
jgi:hypothetical protein